ncbi:hypothetical protein [Phaeobacter sp. B1627]|uniref:hypothetical protein n=1 Tax=Phaeobacter sp. B1627 TaxID=2583809 RepID=UPI001118D8D8|nr:hypothetical protein [Phaeobacter sp. B1627]TNJ45577.1 hypothetical protein FGE21_06380 [Phaeobacter sp. B1627]
MGIRVTALTVAATVVCALGTGLFMQKRAELQRSADPYLPGESGAADTAELVLQDVAFTSVGGSSFAPSEPDRQPGRTTPTCPMEMNLTALPGALVQVEINAPCRAGERFGLHHAGMIITEGLDLAGHFTGAVPALTEYAVIIADFVSGSDLQSAIHVDELRAIDRVALQWQGGSGLELHALEFGAFYGEPGHVWRGSSADEGVGRVLSIGDPDQAMPQMVQVYSLPTDQAPHHESGVAISVEAEITTANCDRAWNAQLFEHRAGRLSIRDLILTMPDCSATGDFLVLNNLVETLKIAAN